MECAMAKVFWCVSGLLLRGLTAEGAVRVARDGEPGAAAIQVEEKSRRTA
jgi:hypothetical protein